MAGLKRVTDAIKAERKREAFRRKCNKAAETVGVGVDFYDDGDGRTDQFEDDGTLHICKDGFRACFDVANDIPRIQNERTVAVMTAMKMEKQITDRVLVGETDDDDDNTCPHCGQSMS